MISKRLLRLACTENYEFMFAGAIKKQSNIWHSA